MAPPPLWALGYHQCRWFDYTQDAVEAIGRAAPRRARSPATRLWLDIEYMDGYRVFTWDTEAFPDPPGMLDRLGRQGFRVITIVDPGVKHEPGYWVFDQALERDVLCRTEGGDIYIGQVGPATPPSRTSSPRRRARGGASSTRPTCSPAWPGIWNDMNEPATGAHPAERDAVRPRARTPTSGTTTSTRC